MLKGVFNRNNHNGDSISCNDELHKQILRIDTLEGQMNKLLDSEKQLRVNVYGKAEEDLLKDKGVNAEVNFYKQKVNELSRKINNLEKKHREIELSQKNKANKSSSSFEQNIDEKQLISFIEQIVTEKLAVQHSKEQQMRGKIQTLEHYDSNLNTETKTYRDRGKGRSQGITEPASSEQLRGEERDRAILVINERILSLESKYEKMYEFQAGLVRITDELVEKHNELLKKWRDLENSVNKQNPVYETLYIDKLYLEKYEQNNNFAQIGIKELSGALNIGATYGKDVIPKKVTEEVKDEMEKLKEVKKEMEKLKEFKDEEEVESEQDSKEETEFQAEESSSFESDSSEEKEGFIDIIIEDDDSSDKGDDFI